MADGLQFGLASSSFAYRSNWAIDGKTEGAHEASDGATAAPHFVLLLIGVTGVSPVVLTALNAADTTGSLALDLFRSTASRGILSMRRSRATVIFGLFVLGTFLVVATAVAYRAIVELWAGDPGEPLSPPRPSASRSSSR